MIVVFSAIIYLHKYPTQLSINDFERGRQIRRSWDQTFSGVQGQTVWWEIRVAKPKKTEVCGRAGHICLPDSPCCLQFCIYLKIHAKSVDEGDGGRLSLPLCDPGSIRFLLLRLAPGRLRDQNQGCRSCDIGIQGLLSPVMYIFRNLTQNFKRAVRNLTANKPGEIPADVASICNVFCCDSNREI